jgi:hypothetical protein
MNKWILRLLAGVAVTGAAGGAGAHNAAVSADEEAWGRTVQVNTLEAYAKFSMEFPLSKFAHKAHLKLASAGISEAIAEGRGPTNEPINNNSEPEFVPNSIMVV